ncbi:Thioredoxin-fold containing protein [Desulfonema limicola]|uniref:Thioredoxin-fold containing protein n=1 Tax=Desulfonema limicola TaxID=45656 RepID=A0A975GFD6_9BACT|nr:thioredoxin family protein [Desulfonema limicola]QTA79064.1 Thioredoxin-fold containing protein [Desulfonema limicola]
MDIAKFFKCLSIIVICLSFSCLDLSASETIKEQDINWQNYEAGMALGKNKSKKILINFYADWCTYCKKMDKDTYTNKSVISYINENFIPIKVNSDKNRKIAMNYRVTGLPSTWFVAETGENIGNRPGYIDAETMIPILKYIHTDSYKSMSFKDFMDKR